MSQILSPSKAARNAAEKEMRRLKLDALEKGTMTDFAFLLGPEKETAEVRFSFYVRKDGLLLNDFQLVHCFKSDLLMASDYFRALVNCSLTGPCPVHEKHVKPHIFKLVIRQVFSAKINKSFGYLVLFA